MTSIYTDAAFLLGVKIKTRVCLVWNRFCGSVSTAHRTLWSLEPKSPKILRFWVSKTSRRTDGKNWIYFFEFPYFRVLPGYCGFLWCTSMGSWEIGYADFSKKTEKSVSANTYIVNHYIATCRVTNFLTNIRLGCHCFLGGFLRKKKLNLQFSKCLFARQCDYKMLHTLFPGGNKCFPGIKWLETGKTEINEDKVFACLFLNALPCVAGNKTSTLRQRKGRAPTAPGALWWWGGGQPAVGVS